MAKARAPWLETRGDIWYVHWYDKSSRHLKRLSLGTRDAREAEARFAAWLVERSRLGSRPAPNGTYTCAMALEDYRLEHVIPNVVDKERVDYTIMHLNAFFADMPIADVDIPLCRAYCAKRATGEIGQVSGTGTQRRELSTLSAAAHHAVRWKRIGRADLPIIDLPQRGLPRERWLTEPELTDLLAAASPRAMRFILIAYFTGARRRSIETLTKFQVDLKQMRISLNPSGRRQTKKRRPVVPIDKGLTYALTEAMAEPGEFVLGHSGSIRKAFESAVAKAKLEGVTPHTLRHTRAVHLAQRGVSLYVIAGLLGDTVATVEKNYLHHCPEHLRAALDEGREIG